MVMRFDENKTYWLGNIYPEIGTIELGVYYLTPNFEYAVRYARQSDGHWGCMLKCSLSKTHNIFDSKNKIDLRKYNKYLLDNNISNSEYLLCCLYDDTRKIRQDTRELQLIDYLKNLKYYGFFNYELNYDELAINLFSNESIVIKEILIEQDIIDYIKCDEKLINLMNQEIMRLESGDPYATGHLVPYDDLMRIYNTRPSVESYKEGLIEYKRYLENIYDKDPNGCRVRLETINRQISVVENKDKYKNYMYLDNLFGGNK